MVFYRGVKRPISIIYKSLNSSICFGHGYSTLRRNGNSIAESRGYFHKHGNGPRTFAVSIRRYSAEISSSEQMNLIKLLRERTKAAQKDLRKRGIVLASKKSSRTAAEGLLALAQNEKKAAVIELNCETDFVARNEIFQYLASSLAKLALLLEGSGQSFAAFPVGHLEELKLNLDHPKLSGEKSVQNAIAEVAAMMGENVKLRRGFAVSAPSLGVISTYLHTSPQPGVGVTQQEHGSEMALKVFGLWKDVVQAKYGCNCHWCSNTVRSPYGCELWRVSGICGMSSPSSHHFRWEMWVTFYFGKINGWPYHPEGCLSKIVLNCN
ncbi:Elongation factor Ts, mitochondrial [Capsicum annuum]|nr:Elongation factor Ts, mitochondrial [Capsicum annuum]